MCYPSPYVQSSARRACSSNELPPSADAAIPQFSSLLARQVERQKGNTSTNSRRAFHTIPRRTGLGISAENVCWDSGFEDLLVKLVNLCRAHEEVYDTALSRSSSICSLQHTSKYWPHFTGVHLTH